MVHHEGRFHVDGERTRSGERSSLASAHVTRRRHKRPGADAETCAPKLGSEYRGSREAERGRRLGAAQLARNHEVADVQLGLEAACNTHQSKGRQCVKPRGKINTRAARTVASGTDDDVGTADGTGFDPKRRQYL